jgi:hypothetical protein
LNDCCHDVCCYAANALQQFVKYEDDCRQSLATNCGANLHLAADDICP